MRTSYGVGQYQASEGDLLCGPHRAVGSSRGCLFFSGLTSNAAACLSSAFGEDIIRAIARAGVPVMTADWGGSATWGNSTAQTRIATGVTYQQTAQNTRTDKVVLAGISMGSVTALRYAMANPTKVAAVALILPIPDLQDTYDNVGALTAGIDTAYGGRPADADNPALDPGAFDGIPIRMWYSTDDTVALPGPVETFARATGAELTSLGAVGHVFDGVIDPDQVADYLVRYV